MKFDNLNIVHGDSKKLLISFGGINQGMGMPVYEFYNSLRGFSCDKVYIKDIYQAWYHKGINENVSNILKLKEFLHEIISKKPYEKVVFVGNSMGGYGAILFGVLLNVDNVIAFSPQTFIDKMNRFWNNDKRWSSEISNLYSDNSKQVRFYNLKNILKKTNYRTNIEVFYSVNDEMDSIHAKRLTKQSNVKINPCLKGNHNLIRVLRDEGKLIKIIRTSLGGRQCRNTLKH